MTLDDSIIHTAEDYFKKAKPGKKIDWDGTAAYGSMVSNENGYSGKVISIDEYNLVGDIIATQVAFYALRRLRMSCESNCDNMRRIMKAKIKEYEDTYGNFFNYNEDNIW
jgi:hypothetical protein